jgi:hypothetical protein
MAESKPTTMTANEVQSLADRLFSRGVSKLLDDSPSMQADLRTASRVIRSLLSEIDKVAAIANDVAHNLAHLRVTVDG